MKTTIVMIIALLPVLFACGARAQVYYDRDDFTTSVLMDIGQINFDDILPQTDITGFTFSGEENVTFDTLDMGCDENIYRCGIQESAPLIVIQSIPPLPAASGDKLVSPGGASLSSCHEPLLENDDLRITFDPPVHACGLDIVFKSFDGFSFVGIRFVDPGGQILFEESFIPIPNRGMKHPGMQFVGFNAGNSDYISSVEIDEYDQDCNNPDEHVGYDSVVYSRGVVATELETWGCLKALYK